MGAEFSITTMTNEAFHLHETLRHVPPELASEIASRKPSSLNDITSFLNLVLMLEAENISKEWSAMLDKSATFLENLAT